MAERAPVARSARLGINLEHIMQDREQIEMDARAELQIRRTCADEAARREAQRMARKIKRLRRKIKRGTYPGAAKFAASIPALLADVQGGGQ